MMWLVAAVSIVGNVMNIRRMRSSFVVWGLTNVAWITYDLSIEAYAQAALFAVYLALCVWGWFAWKEPSRNGKLGA